MSFPRLLSVRSFSYDLPRMDRPVSTPVSAAAKQPTASIIEINNTREKFDEQRMSPTFKPQFIAAFFSCLAAVAVGTVVAYTSPALPDLNSPGRRFSLDDGQQSLVGSLTTVGALCGGLIAGIAVDFFGRRSCLVYLTVPFVVGWLLIVYAPSVKVMYAGRFLTGLCTGVVCLNTPVYMAEIASPEIRGILGSGFQLFVNVGIFFSYLIGSFVPWSHLAFVSAVVPVVTMIAMTYMPESPIWLVRQKRMLEAGKNLEWLRGKDYDVKSEMDGILRELQSEGKISICEFFKPALLKPLLVMEAQMFMQQFSGITAVVFNAVAIFKLSGDAIDPNMQAVIVASLMILASIVASAFVDKAGRRILLMISAGSMSASLCALGGFFFAMEMDPEVADKVGWLPVVCLVIYNCVYSLGFGPVPWLMMGEMFPSNARGLASSIVTASSWTFAFITTQSFLVLQSTLHSYGVFWMFGGVSAGAVVFVWFFVPETKGKTLEEIQQFFT